MNVKKKGKNKPSLSDKIAESLLVKPTPDIEDDNVFKTKPKTLTKADFSSDSEEERVISNFRKANVKLLSEISSKYDGEISTAKKTDEFESSDTDDSEEVKNSSAEEKDAVSDFDDNDEEVNDINVSDSEDFASDASGGLEIDSDDSENLIGQSKKEDEENDGSEDEENDGSEDEENDGSEDEENDGSEAESYEDDEEGFDLSQVAEPPKETFEHMKKENVSEEVKKGNCVRNQLLLWENLLELRIHMQRVLVSANQLPLPETYQELKADGGEDFVSQTNKVKGNISSVLDKLLNLQNTLLSNYPETKSFATKQAKSTQQETLSKKPLQPVDSDEEIPSDTEEEDNANDDDNKKEVQAETSTPAKRRKLEDYSKELAARHQTFTPYRNSVIQKWNEKTRVATASAHKGTAANTVLSQINYILTDRTKLVKRTQLKRSEYDIVGYNKEVEDKKEVSEEGVINPAKRDRKDDDEYVTEIFDDSDFYHQLLRELIECKSADITDPVQLSRQWIALQQMRSKMKRKVDTKATKGRRIKYVVHNKLINYMAPEKSETWTDESRNELFNSVFGKMYESYNQNSHGNDFLKGDVTKVMIEGEEKRVS